MGGLSQWTHYLTLAASNISNATTSVCRASAGSVLARHLFHTGGPRGARKMHRRRVWWKRPRLFSFLILFPAPICQKKCAACSCFKCQDLLLLLSSWTAGPRGAGPGLRSRFPESSSRLLTGARVLAPSRCEERRPRVGVGWLEEPVNSS